MLNNREIIVDIRKEISKMRLLNNGLPQGLMLAPLLFNLHIKYLLPTSTRKCNADVIVLASQNNTFEILENTLTHDLGKLNSYFKRWRIKPNPLKIEVTMFYLNNRMVSHKINAF